MDELDPAAFEVRRATVRGVDLAYVREGVGGFPLVLLHGWPETMRIWWRYIRPLADAGFEVIVPDLRGFGLSGQPPDGFHDVVAQARDIEALVRGELGHDRAVTCGGDIAPAITEATAGCASSHDTASSSSVCPRDAANWVRPSTTARFCATNTFVAHPPSARRVPQGGRWPQRYLPVRSPLASGK